MTAYRVHAHLTMGAALGAGPETQFFVPSLRHLPGSVLRGALAQAWIREHGRPLGALRNEFVELFEHGIAYRSLTPEGSQWTPLSVAVEKYGAPGQARQRVDLAVNPGLPPGWEMAKPGQTLAAAVRVDTRVQLTEHETAEPSRLHSRQSVRGGQHLHGWVVGDHPWLEGLAKAQDPLVVRVGGQKSVAGRAELRFERAEPPLPEVRDDGQVIVRLTAPAICVDAWGAPESRMPLAEIADLLGLDPSTPYRQWSRLGRLGGWHQASGLPKPDEVVLEPGSTVVFDAAPGSVDPTTLGGLWREGIGLRRAEGFGAVSVNEPAVFESAPLTEAEPVMSPLSAALRSFETAGFSAERDAAWLRGFCKEAALLAEIGLAADLPIGKSRWEKLTRPMRAALEEMRKLPSSSLNDLGLLLEDCRNRKVWK